MTTAVKSTTRPSLRRRLITLHRWLGLGAAIFWLIQAITGVIILFHWEVKDSAVAGAHRPTDLAAIERRIETLAPTGSKAKIGSVWTTAGLPDRYDINMTEADGTSRTVRVAGDGTVLREREPDGSVLDTAIGIHHVLLAGKLGDWIVTISGLLLLSNLAFGIAAAWPPRGRWRAALTPVNKGPTVARLYSWHRAVGLWVAIPAFVLVGAGTLIKFEHSLGEAIGADAVSLPANPPAAAPRVGFATAAGAALNAIPGSTLTAVTWPGEEDATYRIRVLAPGEIRRAYGAGIVLVDANTGAVRGTYPIADASASRTFMSALYPIHTGEAGGIIGRVLTGLIGVWLATMVLVGTLLWYRRTRRKPVKA